VRSIRVFAKKTWAIPIMNPLLWFMIMKVINTSDLAANHDGLLSASASCELV